MARDSSDLCRSSPVAAVVEGKSDEKEQKNKKQRGQGIGKWKCFITDHGSFPKSTLIKRLCVLLKCDLWDLTSSYIWCVNANAPVSAGLHQCTQELQVLVCELTPHLRIQLLFCMNESSVLLLVAITPITNPQVPIDHSLAWKHTHTHTPRKPKRKTQNYNHQYIHTFTNIHTTGSGVTKHPLCVTAYRIIITDTRKHFQTERVR